jgi:bifunctional DNA-binding transcriptional regulator/antitoxin component of YhaV-PrlF toxin-antitoxin module
VVPLTEAVCFKVRLEACGRVMVPKQVRWRFKLESSQVLRVEVRPLELRFWSEEFYGRMDKRGRLTVPKLVLELMEKEFEEGRNLLGSVLDVTIEPA